MTRLEKCQHLKEKGYTYDPETGKIYGMTNNEIIRKDRKGYIILKNHLKAHHYAYYCVYGNVDFIELDHENRDRCDNRICNLRISNRTQQNQNRANVKGYSWNKKRNKYESYIHYNKKKMSLGFFNFEEEAKNAYIEAKKKYHSI